jgi:hypothetical protein
VKNDNNNAVKLNGKLPRDEEIKALNDIPRDRTNGQVSNGNVPRGNGLCNNACDEEFHTEKIPVFNYSCDILKRPFTWKEFMKLNEDQEPLMPSSQSVG